MQEGNLEAQIVANLAGKSNVSVQISCNAINFLNIQPWLQTDEQTDGKTDTAVIVVNTTGFEMFTA